MDKPLIIIIIIIILVGILFWAIQSGFLVNIFSGGVKPTSLPQGIVLFYGQGCPHCADVDEYIKTNNIDKKVQFIKLEVWYNKSNAALLTQIVQKCKISSGSVGIPFLYDGKNCLIGETDVINFFKNAANIKQ